MMEQILTSGKKSTSWGAKGEGLEREKGGPGDHHCWYQKT